MMFLSSKAKSILLSMFVLLSATQVLAQEIKSASFANSQSAMGNSVDLTINFQSTGGTTWCGLLIEWGDGEKQSVRVGDDNYKTSPITLTHKYATAGTFNATVKGNTMVRGLKTAQACGGAVKPAQINIIDTVAIQQAEARRVAAEREKAALEEAERAKKSALEEADRAKKALEAKEFEMKRKELEMKEEMLKREEDLRKREDEARKRSQQRPPAATPAPAAAPAPTPAPAPAPAPTGSKPAVKPASGF
jgi:hypothetical protein